ncbi:MAG: diguanylate cyclase [Thermoanaerobaculia bacterium]|nr:diguanylate cyclase [Thermoanaerobaculia bacterium]
MAPLALSTRRVSPPILLAVALPLIALVGVVDWATGPVAMSLLYYIPIVAAAWLTGVLPGTVTALASGVSLTTVALLQAQQPTSIIYWNSFTRIVTFVALGVFVALIRRDRDQLDELNGRLNAALANEAGLARTDALTGLANGRAFRETLSRELLRSKREGGAIAVAYLDLDNFKRINDAFGHDEGDRVLRRTAGVLTESVRAIDLVARIGGDEFVVAIVNPGETTCDTVGSRILEKIQVLAAEYPGTDFGATIGFASFHVPPSDVEVLLKLADDAMYEVKAQGKGRFVVAHC